MPDDTEKKVTPIRPAATVLSGSPGTAKAEPEAEAAGPVEDVKPPKPPELSGARGSGRTALTRFEQHRTTWGITAPAAAVPEDCRRPEFYRLVAGQLRRDDILRILADDGSWEVEAIVDHPFPSRVEVSIAKVMSRSPVKRNSTILGDGVARTEYRAGAWCIVRVKDGHVLIEGRATEGAAIGQWQREQPVRVA